MKYNLILLALGVVTFITTLFFVGFYLDHHGDTVIFIKHKPTFKLYFYPPHQWTPRDLTKKEELEEEGLFQEYIMTKQVSDYDKWIAYFLIQLSLTLLVCGVYVKTKRKKLKLHHLITHFIACLLPTIMSLFYIVYSQKNANTLVFTFLIVAFGFIMIYVIDKVQKTQRLKTKTD